MMQGDLQTVPAPQLLNLIRVARKSGTLTVFRNPMDAGDLLAAEPDSQVTIHYGVQRVNVAFDNGQPAFSAAAERNLIRILHRAGKLTDRQVEMLTDRQSNNEKSMAVLLIGGNYVSRDDILEVLQKQLWDDLYALLAWTSGSFIFEEDVAPDQDSTIMVTIDLVALLDKHSERVREVEQLLEAIPDLDVSLQFAEGAGRIPQRQELSSRGWRIISEIKPKTSIRQIAQMHSMSELEVRRAVLELIEAGLVVLDEPVRVRVRRQPISGASGATTEGADVSIFDTLVDGIQSAAHRIIKSNSNEATSSPGHR